MTKKKMAIEILTTMFTIFLFYTIIAFFVFQWRNPKSNEMSYYRNFVDVITWQKLDEYQ